MALTKQKLKNFKAILFDMDGVLIDSMPYHYISWFETLKKYNARITAADIFEMEGAKWDKIVRLAFKRENKVLSKDLAMKICDERKNLFRQSIKKYIFEGIEDFLKKLKAKGFLLGLVSGSSLQEAENMLPKNIIGKFDVKVTGDMVKKGKPHPEPYLTAAKKLSISAKDCLVIENAPYGIKSAKSAKMCCIAIETSLQKHNLSKADLIFANHKKLYRYFGM
ncbi:MAG: HAD family phosphatase [Elusimicrobiota bacterium]|jgi:beta-phosphoglucomutase|nr:HAD family phosphatase [Elusimicrobiota bacterium]